LAEQRAAGHPHFKQIRRARRAPIVAAVASAGRTRGNIDMRIFFANLLALSVLAAASPPAQAASGGDCATLSSNAEAIVVGARSGQKHLLIHDGGAYYRVEFFREPYDFPSSVPQQIRLTSNKRPRTLCATARTTVKSGDGRIHFARRVDPIRPDEYERYARTARQP
jgi:hypothetical protein